MNVILVKGGKTSWHYDGTLKFCAEPQLLSNKPPTQKVADKTKTYKENKSTFIAGFTNFMTDHQI